MKMSLSEVVSALCGRNAHAVMRRASAGGVILLWAGITTIAFGHFWRLDAEPGTPAAPPLKAVVAADRFNVLVFLHPQCPCSRATLAELSRVAAKVERPVHFRVYFAVSDAGDQSWQTSSLYEQAIRLPEVTISADVGGANAKKFGVETSGQILVYRPDGALAFAGGITGSRGHEGDNAGESRLLAVLNSTSQQQSAAPVYGCRLPVSCEISSKVKP